MRLPPPNHSPIMPAGSPRRPPSKSCSNASGKPSANCCSRNSPSTRATLCPGSLKPRTRAAAITLDLGRAQAILPHDEQVGTERYRKGQRVKVFVLSVRSAPKGPEILVSRSHRNVLRRLFEIEVPEVYNGVVEIKAIAREAGFRSKVAVSANQPGIDPVGSCIGIRGNRIQSIVNELQGEKIDIVSWDSDPRSFIANSLSPSEPVQVELLDAEQTAVVVVPDRQLSLAIGKEGQNTRLAARLTGWRLDIKGMTEWEEIREARLQAAAEAAAAAAAKAAEKAAAIAEAAALAELEAEDAELVEAVAEAEAIVEEAAAESPVTEGSARRCRSSRTAGGGHRGSSPGTGCFRTGRRHHPGNPHPRGRGATAGTGRR